MKCPDDGTILKAGEAETHTGYGCSSCKGSWLPKRYIDSIQYSKEFDAETFFKTLSNKKSKSTQLKCPSNCGVLSSIPEMEGISYCTTCLGVWFESRALKNMLNNYQNKEGNSAFADIPNATIGIFGLLGALFK